MLGYHTAKYTIIVATTVDLLVDRVQSFIERGWECQGGVLVVPETGIYQAMIKIIYEEEEND
jgi:hypothetical protein